MQFISGRRRYCCKAPCFWQVHLRIGDPPPVRDRSQGRLREKEGRKRVKFNRFANFVLAVDGSGFVFLARDLWGWLNQSFLDWLPPLRFFLFFFWFWGPRWGYRATLINIRNNRGWSTELKLRGCSWRCVSERNRTHWLGRIIFWELVFFMIWTRFDHKHFWTSFS